MDDEGRIYVSASVTYCDSVAYRTCANEPGGEDLCTEHVLDRHGMLGQGFACWI